MKNFSYVFRKIIIPICLTLCMVFFCAQCGSETEKNTSSTQSNNTSSVVSKDTASVEGEKNEPTFEEKVKAMGTGYWEEYNDTRDKLVQNQNDDTFSFLMLTDIHIDYTKVVADGEYWYTTPVGLNLPDRYNIQNEIAMVIEMANTTDVDCILLGGDLVHGTRDHLSALSELDYLAEVFKDAKIPVFATRGNHDRNDYHGKPCAIEHIITNEEWTTHLINPLAKDMTVVRPENDPTAPYYYVDFPDKKTRLISLDAWNYPIITDDGVHSVYGAENGWDMYGDDAQVDWFANVALDPSKDGWNYVVLSHAPITGAESGSSANANLIRDIIRAFNNKTAVSVLGQSIDFSNCKGTLELSVSGHTHIQSWRYLDNNHVAINTGSGRFAYYPTEVPFDSATGKEYQPVRYEGTYSQALFDAICYDPKGRTAMRFNFGNRPDNIFEFSDTGIVHTEGIHQEW